MTEERIIVNVTPGEEVVVKGRAGLPTEEDRAEVWETACRFVQTWRANRATALVDLYNATVGPDKPLRVPSVRTVLMEVRYVEGPPPFSASHRVVDAMSGLIKAAGKYEPNENGHFLSVRSAPRR